MPQSPLSDDSPAPLWPRRVLVVIVSFVLAIGCAEGAVRVALADRLAPGFLHPRPEASVGVPDPLFGWRLRADLDVPFKGRGYSYHLRTDAEGWRDDSHEPLAAPGVKRVLVLGDSFMWGWGVERRERASDLVADELGDGVEVINRAVPGFSTDQELWVLEAEGERLRPDVVVLGVNGGDARQNGRTFVPPYPKRCFRPALGGGWEIVNPDPPPESTIDASATSAMDGFLLWALARGELPLGAPARFVDPARVALQPAHPFAVGSTTHMLLGRIAGHCKSRGRPLIVLAIASAPAEAWLTDTEMDAGSASDPLFPHTKRLVELAPELGFEVVVLDRAEVDAVRAGREPRIPGDWHWSVAGNRAVADALLPAVRSALAR